MKYERLILFLDAQNFYNGARRAFFPDADAHSCGQIKPMELGNLICARQPSHVQTKLQQVRVYTGRPDSSKEPKTYAAHIKQCATWARDGAQVIFRALRYLADWPASKPEEKGIDVALAIDFVALAVDGGYDIGVIASTDSDLRPALEFVSRKCGERCRVQVASWTSPRTKSRLSIPGKNVWCHWLHRTDYDAIADSTDYDA